MKHSFRNFLLVFAAILAFSNCAKKGAPTGGAKDSIPPVIIKSTPENFSINFTGDEIRIFFDEYIKLKDLQQNLIVSPPLKYQPIITPLSTSKILKIKILDTLKENTTYSFNFGKSIVDNNEENEFEYFKYVFSTGSYIDSLTLSGTVRDARRVAPEGTTTVMLYELTEAFADSLIYTEKPTYITTTRDSTQQFELTNLKEGNYMLLGLKENVNNYTFEPSSDKIAFIKQAISLPTDSTYVLSLFKEAKAYELTRPSHVAKNRIVFGYTGKADSLEITPLSQVPEGFTARTTKDLKKDTLNYWFKPAIDVEQTDTLLFWARNQAQLDTLTVRMKDLFADSLQLDTYSNTFLRPKDTVQLSANIPIVSFDVDKIKVINRDSLDIETRLYLDEKKNILSLIFDKEDDQTYNMEVLPGAITDFFDATNDSLNLRARTRPLSDYGTIRFGLANVREFPILVELVDSKFEVVAEDYLLENREIYFDYVNPGSNYIRITYDTNQNGVWDTGSFLERLQPETTIYYPALFEFRGNWDLNETNPPIRLPGMNPGLPKIEDDPEE